MELPGFAWELAGASLMTEPCRRRGFKGLGGGTQGGRAGRQDAPRSPSPFLWPRALPRPVPGRGRGRPGGARHLPGGDGGGDDQDGQQPGLVQCLDHVGEHVNEAPAKEWGQVRSDSAGRRHHRLPRRPRLRRPLAADALAPGRPMDAPGLTLHPNRPAPPRVSSCSRSPQEEGREQRPISPQPSQIQSQAGGEQGAGRTQRASLPVVGSPRLPRASQGLEGRLRSQGGGLVYPAPTWQPPKRG